MMNSIRGFTKNFIKYFIYIAVFAQIVSGTVYLVCNFSSFVLYPETEEMLHAARTLVFDEYIGFLYPLFLRICYNLQNLCGVGYYLTVHGVQVLAVFFSAYYLMRSLFKGKSAWIYAAYIMSIPMCMQTALMVSPFAFKLVFSFIIGGSMVRLWKKVDRPGYWALLLVFWGLAVFNLPDDLFVWGVPVLVFAIIVCFRKTDKIRLWKKVCLLLAVVVVFLGILGTVNVVTQPGARGRMHKNVGSVLYQRVIWPDLEQKFTFLPYDICYYWNKAESGATDSSAELITNYMGPRIEKNLGVERAEEVFLEAVITQLSYNKKEQLTSISRDFFGYLFTPYSMLGYMQGEDGSAQSTLYGRMSMSNPKMTYHYFSVFYVSLFVLTFAAVIKLVTKRKGLVKGNGKPIFLVVMAWVYQALWYTIVNVQGVDYRYALFQTAVFAILILTNTGILENEGSTQKNEPKQRKIFFKKPVVIGVFACVIVACAVLVVLDRDAYKKSDLMEECRIVCLGDSIWGLVKDETGIASLVENMTGATVDNYAVPGSTASDFDTTVIENLDERNLCRIIGQMQAEDSKKSREILDIEAALQEADYLILAYGLNDYFQGFEADTKEKEDLYTYEGALKNAVEYVKKKYPNVKIVLVGQTYCQFYAYGIVEDDSDTRDFGGGVGTDYVQAAARLAKEYGLLFVDMYQEIPMNEWNGIKYLEDATHLNEKGRQKYAKAVSECLLNDYRERNAQ